MGRWVALLRRSSLLMTKLKVKALKKMHWLAAGLVGSMLCLAAPVRAGELSSWKFDPSNNRLEFNTETGVQPRAQLVTGPTRLVIDLPGTTWSRSQVLEALGGGSFQNLRISQYDENTARIIVELAPGYTQPKFSFAASRQRSGRCSCPSLRRKRALLPRLRLDRPSPQLPAGQRQLLIERQRHLPDLKRDRQTAPTIR
jgi:N-acetylmuramoyl-L-alanine amidase